MWRRGVADGRLCTAAGIIRRRFSAFRIVSCGAVDESHRAGARAKFLVSAS